MTHLEVILSLFLFVMSLAATWLRWRLDDTLTLLSAYKRANDLWEVRVRQLQQQLK
jgi:hypothetical protein